MKKNNPRNKSFDYHIYVAGPLFTPGDRYYLEIIEQICKQCKFSTYLPHRDAGLAPSDGSLTLPFFEKDVKELLKADIVVSILNGTDVDSGTAWELGYAYAKDKILIGIYDDTRIYKPLASFNLMISTSTNILNSVEDLKNELVFIRETYLDTQNSFSRSLHKDINLVKKIIDKLNLDFNSTTPETFGYKYPAICCLDAVLSINRQYKTFVVPRITEFRNKHPNIKNLKQLLDLIELCGIEKFANDILNYRHYERVELLRKLILKLLDIRKTSSNPADELISLRNWAQLEGINGYKTLNIKGIGIATYQYLRMLMGVDTTKPDIHITKFLEEKLNKKLKPEDCITIIEGVSKKMCIPAICVDHAIWKMQSEHDN